MHVDGRRWVASLSAAMVVHAAIIAAALWDPNEPDMAAAGLGGLSVSLGGGRASPGEAVAPAAVVPEVVPGDPVVEEPAVSPADPVPSEPADVVEAQPVATAEPIERLEAIAPQPLEAVETQPVEAVETQPVEVEPVRTVEAVEVQRPAPEFIEPFEAIEPLSDEEPIETQLAEAATPDPVDVELAETVEAVEVETAEAEPVEPVTEVAETVPQTPPPPPEMAAVPLPRRVPERPGPLHPPSAPAEPQLQPTAEPRATPTPPPAAPTAPAPQQVAALPPDAGPGGDTPAAAAASGSGAAPGGADSAAVRARYAAQIQAWLARHKDYPRRARMRRQEGIALLYFVVDRSGQVLRAQLQQSSGHDLLDREVMAMIQRAQPLPRMPDSMSQPTLEMVVPVEFFLR